METKNNAPEPKTMLTCRASLNGGKENCRLYCIGIRKGNPMGFHKEHDKRKLKENLDSDIVGWSYS